MTFEARYEAIESPPSVSGVHQYDKGATSRNIAIAGLTTGYLFGSTCVIMGALCRLQLLPSSLGVSTQGNVLLDIKVPFIREVVLFFVNVVLIKFTVGSASSVHETALKWTLAFENDFQTREIRLEFNSNLRFLKSSYTWWSANGLIANCIMASTLAITYAASSMLLLSVETSNDGHNTVLSSVSLIILGSVVLIQVIISTIAICTTNILTWSQSPLDTAAALVASHRLFRNPGRCMHSLYDKCATTKPIKPRKCQVAAWGSHPQFRRFTMYIWMLVAVGYYWCFIIYGMVKSGTQGSTATTMQFGWTGEAPVAGILWGMGILLGFQGGIVTTGVTAAQMLVGLTRDEYIWKNLDRRDDPLSRPGAESSRAERVKKYRKRSFETIRNNTIYKMFFLNWQTVIIHLAEPTIHWLFGLAVSVDAVAGFQIRPLPILYITALATAGVILITLVGNYTPAHPIPSTYGHLQTIVDLVDEWHFPTMYWGHKWTICEDTSAIGHAGTSDKPLPEVTIDTLYGGLCCPSPWWTIKIPSEYLMSYQTRMPASE